ncbi:polysaccharide deacetylase family protein [Desulfohalovibrio reitneri]|uniref:polysaccharide deacetylase family protein n=1 Tax=Desulfohalovibrio reitneri TaxID=1307759 RepID=UPI00137765A9|nr:polysaccharide deacetylase family protein [Desulfohalovibrio reitneri]
MQQVVWKGRKINSPAVMLTFDDGFRDLLTIVAPILRKYGFKALVFAAPNLLRAEGEEGTAGEIDSNRAFEAFMENGDRSAWLSARELRALAGEGLIEVGSHSLSHAKAPVSAEHDVTDLRHWSYHPFRAFGRAPDLRPELAGPVHLASLGRLEQENEFKARVEENLRKSREILSEVSGHTVSSFAWPWGEEPEEGAELVAKSGYELGFTLRRGSCRRSDAPHSLPRREVKRRKGLQWFKREVDTPWWRGLAGR